jgi:hypothetical protein
VNLNEQNWFGQLRVNSKTFDYAGTPSEILEKVILQMVQSEFRNQSPKFDIVIQKSIITDESIRKAKIIQEMNDTIPLSEDNPYARVNNESEEEYVQRLITDHYTPKQFAINHLPFAFGYEPSPRYTQWIEDTLAAKFRRLNSSLEAFQNAGPEEYAIAKKYVEENYPEYFVNIPLRA